MVILRFHVLLTQYHYLLWASLPSNLVHPLLRRALPTGKLYLHKHSNCLDSSSRYQSEPADNAPMDTCQRPMTISNRCCLVMQEHNVPECLLYGRERVSNVYAHSGPVDDWSRQHNTDILGSKLERGQLYVVLEAFRHMAAIIRAAYTFVKWRKAGLEYETGTCIQCQKPGEPERSWSGWTVVNHSLPSAWAPYGTSALLCRLKRNLFHSAYLGQCRSRGRNSVGPCGIGRAWGQRSIFEDVLEHCAVLILPYASSSLW